MLGWLTGKKNLGPEAEQLYARVAQAARNPAYFNDFGVPDTVEGRFELLVLHLFLALERVRQELGQGEALTQRTIEVFVTDMDDCMREMGVGDLSVPKKVKTAAAVFYARSAVYRPALTARDTGQLASALGAFLNQDATKYDRAARFAADVLRMYDRIAGQSRDEIFAATGSQQPEASGRSLMAGTGGRPGHD